MGFRTLGAPTRRERDDWAAKLNAAVVVLDTDPKTCIERIKQDESRCEVRKDQILAVKRWWRLYRQGFSFKGQGSRPRGGFCARNRVIQGGGQNGEEPMIESETWPADEVTRKPLSELVPYAQNARTHTAGQIRQIAASMQYFK